MQGLVLIGEVRKIYRAPDFTDKTTGEVTEGRHKVQVEFEETLSNGELKLTLQTLSCHDVQVFDALKGKQAIIPVGVIPNGKQITYFIPKGARITAHRAQLAATGS
jgi:hypothetical protein